jgi:SAM-dependent methyltransferase
MRHESVPKDASPYDAIARLYDPWSVSVTEDVPFYLDEARKVAPGPVVELGVGTGRIAVPIAAEGIRVIGVDSSRGMLEVCAESAALAGAAAFLDLRVGDLRDPPVTGPVLLVLAPFRSLLHLQTDEERLSALAAIRRLLPPGGRFVFDVFEPGADDIADTHGRWLEREPGIWERADWDEQARTLTLSVRGESGETTMALGWLSATEWRTLLERAGFLVKACYGWFDRRRYTGGEDMVWVAVRPDDEAG